MSLIDFILLAIFGVICYRLGQFIKNHEKDLEPTIIEVKSLTLEKIDNVYYAYVGDNFAGQSKSIDELVLNMRDVYKVKLFNFDKIEGISNEEYDLFLKSIEKWYTIV